MVAAALAAANFAGSGGVGDAEAAARGGALMTAEAAEPGRAGRGWFADGKGGGDVAEADFGGGGRFRIAFGPVGIGPEGTVGGRRGRVEGAAGNALMAFGAVGGGGSGGCGRVAAGLGGGGPSGIGMSSESSESSEVSSSSSSLSPGGDPSGNGMSSSSSDSRV